jgi:hypothetical protein
MSDDGKFERNARAWLELGPTDAPDRVVQGALLEIESTRQERDLRIPWRLPSMNPLTRLMAAAAAIAVFLAVGGMLVGPRLGPGGAPPPSPSASASSTPRATAITPATTPGASADDAACKLITPDEAKNVTDNPGLGAFPAATGVGATTTCIYSTGGGDIVLTVAYTRSGGAAAFAAVKAASGVQPVRGVGTDAVFDPATETLSFVKGDALVVLRSGLYVTDRLAAETTLGKLAASRI